jgi:predicted MFS family arabinose efflux permease
VAGFVVTISGIALLLALVPGTTNIGAFVPGLFLVGFGLGAMLTPSVNVVQSSFPEELQGEISGLSRSVSNLGSSLGTAIGGTILISVVATGNRAYGIAMATLAVIALIGLWAAIRLPSDAGPAKATSA